MITKEERKIIRRRKLNAYCEKATCSARLHGAGYKTDEKKLQNAFGDRNLSLRYRLTTKMYEVWHMVPNRLFKCLLVIDDPYNIGRAIEVLTARQVTALQRRDEYLEQQRENEYKTNKKIADVSGTIADAADMHRKGKLSVAFHGA